MLTKKPPNLLTSTCSKLTIKNKENIHGHCSSAFIVDFEQIVTSCSDQQSLDYKTAFMTAPRFSETLFTEAATGGVL